MYISLADAIDLDMMIVSSASYAMIWDDLYAILYTSVLNWKWVWPVRDPASALVLWQ